MVTTPPDFLPFTRSPALPHTAKSAFSTLFGQLLASSPLAQAPRGVSSLPRCLVFGNPSEPCREVAVIFKQRWAFAQQPEG